MVLDKYETKALIAEYEYAEFLQERNTKNKKCDCDDCDGEEGCVCDEH